MSYVYKEFQNETEIDAFFERLNEEIYLPIEEWHKEKGLVLYGYIDKKERRLPNYPMICFGRTITPEKIESLPKVGIFSNIKTYGSSKKYRGLRDIRGNVILDAMYEEILPLCEYDYDVLLLVKRAGLYGVVKEFSNGEKAQVLVPPRYEKIFDAQEYTLGFVENGAVGFMDLEGNVVIQPMFQDIDGNNIYINGKAQIQSIRENSIPYYINHYGNLVMDVYDYSDVLEHNLSTSYYLYGDLPSCSDVYEGDISNRWNSD